MSPLNKSLLTLFVIMLLALAAWGIQTAQDSRASLFVRACLWTIALGIIVILVALTAHFAHARDDGRYAASPLKQWFDGLRSGKGPCCSDADGSVLESDYWEVRNGHYRVRIPNKNVPGDPMIWVDVPDDAVLGVPNLAGRTMVWPLYGATGASIRCFIPGSMT